MEISDLSAARARRQTGPAETGARPRPATGDAPPVDRIEVSEAGRSLVTADELSRARRIAQLRAEVDAGTYRVDATTLAQRLADEGEA